MVDKYSGTQNIVVVGKRLAIVVVDKVILVVVKIPRTAPVQPRSSSIIVVLVVNSSSNCISTVVLVVISSINSGSAVVLVVTVVVVKRPCTAPVQPQAPSYLSHLRLKMPLLHTCVKVVV